MNHRQPSRLPLVDVILLNWNQQQLTVDCLKSLRAVNYPNTRLLLVDNGSTDDSVAHIRQHFPEVIVLENKQNLGYTEANNVGIRYALQGTAPYIMLLNNDTIVDPDMIGYLIAVAESHPSYGIVTPKIYYYDDPKRIWCAGADVDMERGSTTRLRAEELDEEDETEPYEVGFASGCAMCLKREVIEQIGLMDPRFFIYYDETDWCVRAHFSGWKVLYVPQARIWHKVSAAMGTTSPATDYYMNRNVLLFLAKNQQGWQRAITLLRVGGRSLVTILAFTVKSHKGQRLRNRNARVLALRDSIISRWGKMGDDVAKVCYPVRS